MVHGSKAEKSTVRILRSTDNEVKLLTACYYESTFTEELLTECKKATSKKLSNLTSILIFCGFLNDDTIFINVIRGCGWSVPMKMLVPMISS